jgi:hypothetical protein
MRTDQYKNINSIHRKFLEKRHPERALAREGSEGGIAGLNLINNIEFRV